MGLDYYGLLEISRDASDEDIKKAYRKLSLQYHPKRNDSKDPDRFQLVCEAYDVLSEPKTRALFDQYGEEALKKGIPVTPGPREQEGPIETYSFHGNSLKTFRDFFGVDNPFADFYLPNLDPDYEIPIEPEKPGKGPDQEHIFPLSLEDAFYGTTKSIGLPMECVDATGLRTEKITKTFNFTIPKGTVDGHCFYFKGAGTSGPNMLPGDVTFKAQMMPHPKFQLEGHDFVTFKTLFLGHALTGCVIHVSTFDGKMVHIPITQVIKPKHRIYLKGEGMPIIGLASKGDLVVEFDVSFPEKLSFNQQALIRQAFLKSSYA